MSWPTFWPNPEWSLGFGTWFNNFVYSGAEHYTTVDLATIRCPYTEYFIFSVIKSLQISSLVGYAVRPFYSSYLYKKLKPSDYTNNTDKIITAACRRLQGRILIGGIISSPLLMAASLVYNNYTKEKLINRLIKLYFYLFLFFRCYEIRTDKDILAYDRMTLIFGGIGWYWKRFQGAVDGINFALLYIIFHLKISKKYLNPISPDIHELIGNEKYKNVEDAEFNRQKLFQFIKKKLESINKKENVEEVNSE